MQKTLTHLDEQVQQSIGTLLSKLESEMGEQLLSVFLFGSRARNDADSDSDIDLVVLLKETTPEIKKRVRYLAADVWLEHGLHISTRVWSLAHWQRPEELQTGLYRNIQRESIEITSALAE